MNNKCCCSLLDSAIHNISSYLPMNSPEVVNFAQNKFDSNGKLTDEDTRSHLKRREPKHQRELLTYNLYSLILTMDKVSPDGERAAKDVTIVISRKIKPGCEKQYDDWLRRFLMLEFPEMWGQQ